MIYFFTRVIKGNLGDLASRWSLLKALDELGIRNTCYVSIENPEDIPSLDFVRPLTIGRLHNLMLDPKSRNAFVESNAILWSVGLDLSDEFSLLKPILLWISFLFYRLQGKSVFCLFQGAGPLNSWIGRLISKFALKNVSLFIARDSGTYKLIKSLYAKINIIRGYDAIFLPGLEKEISQTIVNKDWESEKRRPVIGFNIRQWFHTVPLKIPYQFFPEYSRKKSIPQMNRIIESAVKTIFTLRDRYDARVILISAYQTGILEWEDDLFWLEKIKSEFSDDKQVQIVTEIASIPEYFTLMSSLDLSISMRLHTSLTALRFEVPTININYTLKGRDILEDMGLGDYYVQLNEFQEDPEKLIEKAGWILDHHKEEKNRIQKTIARIVAENQNILKSTIIAMQSQRKT